MAFLDDIKKNVSDFTGKSVQKVNEISEVSRLNSELTEVEKTLNSHYRELGMQYARLHPQDYEPGLAELMEKISASQKKAAALRESILAAKGLRVCPACGAENAAASVYCGTCGKPIPPKVSVAPEGMVTCPNCGAAVKCTSKFCVQCGNPMPG